MVMPISFIDWLDTRRTFKGYKEPKPSEPSSGAQTPVSKGGSNGKRSSKKENGSGSEPDIAHGEYPPRP